MKENFDECLKMLLVHEGGFINHPRDPGGITNFGVTKRVWEQWVGRKVTEQEMRNLKPSDVAPLYKKNIGIDASVMISLVVWIGQYLIGQ